jgi:hypothetical protein
MLSLLGGWPILFRAFCEGGFAWSLFLNFSQRAGGPPFFLVFSAIAQLWVPHPCVFCKGGQRCCRQEMQAHDCNANPELLLLDDVRINIRSQNRVHAREMAFALSLEPLEYVAVNAQMHGGLAAGHDHPGAFPEICADGRGFRRVGSCLTCAAGGFSFDRAQRISHGSIFLLHDVWIYNTQMCTHCQDSRWVGQVGKV